MVSHSSKYIQYISQWTSVDEYATELVSVVELKSHIYKKRLLSEQFANSHIFLSYSEQNNAFENKYRSD